jgi:hypothetical protein
MNSRAKGAASTRDIINLPVKGDLRRLVLSDGTLLVGREIGAFLGGYASGSGGRRRQTPQSKKGKGAVKVGAAADEGGTARKGITIICPRCQNWFRPAAFRDHVARRHPELLASSWMKEY